MSTTTTEKQPTTVRASHDSPLSVADRCDSCGAQAYGRAYIHDFEEQLLFCAHHLNRHMPKLKGAARHIEDFTAALHKEEAGGLTAV